MITFGERGETVKEFSVGIKDRLRQLDFIILICAVGMSVLSVMILWGCSELVGSRRMIVQSAAAFLGLIVMVSVSLVDYDAILSRFSIHLFVISVVLLLSVLVFGTSNDMGNKSWINIPGINLDVQPSEFVKIIFICTFAKHIDRVKADINKITNLIQLAVHALIIFGCVMLSGDLGSALVFLAIVAVMLFCAGLSLWYFAALLVIAAIAAPILWPHLSEYQQMRIIVGFNPEIDPDHWGYQAILSRKAIVAGGFRGAGLFGGSVYKTLPVATSDFIFAVLCEKLGFFGAFTYILLNCTMVIRLIWLARVARKDYGALICAGVAALLIAQTLENIGMCLAMLPVVGITLPFMSYGGSSMLSLYTCLGLIMSISTHNKKYYFERESA